MGLLSSVPSGHRMNCILLHFHMGFTDQTGRLMILDIYTHTSQIHTCPPVLVCQGNAYFKEGKYDAAVECYSQGMKADGANILLHANRAMAYLKLQK